jgi:predicted dehydrogenase
MSKLRIGIIGAGGIARGAHLNPGWTIAPDVEIAAVCDVNKAAAESLARDFNIPHVFTDFHDLVKLDLDAVDICTPNRVHAPVAIAALNAGKHVLCEKPLAVSPQEVMSMAEASIKAKRILMTAQHFRFTDKITALKRFVESGEAGDFYHARVHAVRRNWLPINPGFINKNLSGGGPCMDIGVHALDAALHIVGFPKPVRVSGKTAVNFAKGNDIPGGWGEWDRTVFGVEDFASGFVHFENGMTLVLEASWLQHQAEDEDFSFHLFGRKGTVQWPSNTYATAKNRVLVGGKVAPATGLKPPHTEEILAFARAIREQSPSPVPVEETLIVISILEGIYQSAQSGREVHIKF